MTLGRYVLRRTLRSPGFSVMVILTIGLGVGINLGVFAVIHAIFLKSVGVPGPDNLVYYTLGGGRDTQFKFHTAAYEALHAIAPTGSVLAWESATFQLQTPDGTTPLDGALVSGNAFSILGLKPFLGRFFGEADDVAGGGKEGWTAVLGNSYWRAHSKNNSHVIGQNITLNGATLHIVGVLPREFTGIEPSSAVNILVPRYFDRWTNPSLDAGNLIIFRWIAFGRRPDGVSIREIQANLKVIEPSFRKAADLTGESASLLFPNTVPGSWLGVQDGRKGVDLEFEALRIPLLILEGLAIAVLFFCCGNLVLLFVSRARREAHATAIRMVLGARLIDQVSLAVVEALVLGTTGCLVAVPIGWVSARVLSFAIQSAPGFDTLSTISPDRSLLLGTVATTLFAACLSGAGATIFRQKNRLSIYLRDKRGATAVRSRTAIIAVEVFATTVLITAAVVSGVGFRESTHHSGFGDGRAVALGLQFKENIAVLEAASQLQRILDQVASYPGVKAVATTNVLPLSGSSVDARARVYGVGDAVSQLHVWPLWVSAQYFSAIGTKIVKGRDFTPDDLANDQVCVLSSRAANTLFIDRAPLGKYVDVDGTVCRVIGVAEDAHFKSMSYSPDAVVYQLSKREQLNIVVRAATSDLGTQAVRAAIQGVDSASVASADVIQKNIERDLRLWGAVTLSGKLSALLLGIILGVGFFGVLSLQVAERTWDIGIRIALGANRIHVCVALMKNLWLAVLMGLTVGSATALIAAFRLAEVYHLSMPLVIGSYLAGHLLLGLLLFLSASVPLSRALSVSPIECLSSE